MFVSVMEKYFKCKSAFPCGEQNVNERNVRDKRDGRDAGYKKDDELGDEMNEIGGTSLGDVPIEINTRDIGDERLEFDVAQLPSDLGLRITIQNYDADVRDVVQRAYVQRGPCQPRNHEFPPKKKWLIKIGDFVFHGITSILVGWNIA
ncbi:uncharacterized protein LOC111399066 [Olea europaea var. sylvestris]|uniref:uncharacterized protein LOC111399066 n=1 Tax=Olea europaea var. sylvestris TaxID=158386 RepID=UPI000C1D467D|nr:uncharacterized protein LOC111399066 [Olea europaea var. sylvestris]